MTCKALGVPWSKATCADDLTEVDRYVAHVMSEAERIYREGMEQQRNR